MPTPRLLERFLHAHCENYRMRARFPSRDCVNSPLDGPSAASDDALAQPTRARLFTMLRDLRRPAGTEELAERLALHPNGVRRAPRAPARGGTGGARTQPSGTRTPARHVADRARRATERRAADGLRRPRPLVGAGHLSEPAHAARRRGGRDGRSDATSGRRRAMRRRPGRDQHACRTRLARFQPRREVESDGG